MADTNNRQDSGPVENKSTQTIMQALANNNQEATLINDFVNRLKKLNLGSDPHMIRLLSAHPNYGNRLISLFKILKDAQVSMSSELELIISKNITNVGGAVNLLGVMNELDLEPQAISLDRLFQAARFDASVVQSARELYPQGVLDITTFELLLTYPEQSLEISRLLMNLLEHAYNAANLVETLLHSSISSEHMSRTLDLLNLMLESDSYYSNAVHIFLRQEQYIAKIYEGAKKLIGEGHPLGNYFELVEKNPQNANIFAKNILLLRNTSLIDPDSPNDLIKVSQLGIGAYHFMKHLQLAGLLNTHNVKKIYQPHNILERPEIIQKLSNLPLITKFEKEELERMLDLTGKAEVSRPDIKLFNDILEEHLIPYNPIPAPTLGCK